MYLILEPGLHFSKPSPPLTISTLLEHIEDSHRLVSQQTVAAAAAAVAKKVLNTIMASPVATRQEWDTIYGSLFGRVFPRSAHSSTQNPFPLGKLRESAKKKHQKIGKAALVTVGMLRRSCSGGRFGWTVKDSRTVRLLLPLPLLRVTQSDNHLKENVIICYELASNE